MKHLFIASLISGVTVLFASSVATQAAPSLSANAAETGAGLVETAGYYHHHHRHHHHHHRRHHHHY